MLLIFAHLDQSSEIVKQPNAVCLHSTNACTENYASIFKGALLDLLTF